MNEEEAKRIYASILEWINSEDCDCELDPHLFNLCCGKKFKLNFEEINPVERKIPSSQ